ncbi:MAG: cobalamin-dependent protein [Hyphomonadaceae bacterium]|jgi:methanogenic corrinoid protein MtbC1|nr:cobalamin-dependent protein [Hyphomonadaceae bacterium]
MDATTTRPSLANTRLANPRRAGALPHSISQGVGRIADAARQLQRQILRVEHTPNHAPQSAHGHQRADDTSPSRPMPEAQHDGAPSWSAARATELADAAIAAPDLGTAEWIEYLLDGPVRPVDLGLAVLGPAAGLLGTMWLDDRASFNQVGLAMWRLRRLHEDLRDRLSLDTGPTPPTGAPRTIVLAAAPGEHHSFGLSLVAGLFETRGWHAEVLAGDDGRSLIAEVAARAVDVAGLTISRADLVPQLSATIAQIRLASLNPDIRIVVGGSLLGRETDCEALRLQLGADSALADARDAVEQVERLVQHGNADCAPLQSGLG